MVVIGLVVAIGFPAAMGSRRGGTAAPFVGAVGVGGIVLTAFLKGTSPGGPASARAFRARGGPAPERPRGSDISIDDVADRFRTSDDERE